MAEISQKLRESLAKQGKAMPDGSYPIRNTYDLRNAIKAFGRATDKVKTKAFIKKRAIQLNAEDLLPDDWKDETLSKAKKGTPEYDEWLRKYQEKRRKKLQEKEEPKQQRKTQSFSDTLKEMVSSHAAPTQQDLFAQEMPETQKEVQSNKQSLFDKYETEKNPPLKSTSARVETATTKQDSRAIQQKNQVLTSAESSPELLKATTTPVFAKLFGHYPVEPIKFSNRQVTSPVEEVDVTLAEEPDEVTQEMLDDPNLIATEKCDGVRCTVICTPEATRLTGRRQRANVGKKPPVDYTNNLPHLRDTDLYAILGDTILDTEAVASNPIETAPGKFGDSLASTMAIVGLDKDKERCIERMNTYGPVLSMAFDIQRYQGHDLRALPYIERMKYLDEAMKKIHDAYGNTYFKRVNSQRPDETKKEFFNRVTTIGGEGLVLAKADHPYKAFDRSGRIKYKRRVELTLQVMSIEEGVGRNKGKAGAFVMGAYINGILTPVANLNVGADDLREDVWKNKDKYLGKSIETTAMQWTLGSGKNGQPKLRHARWKTPGMFRDDKATPDDVSRTIEFLKQKRSK